VAPRSFTLGPESRDHAQQGTVGVAYNGSYGSLADVSIGIQKSKYTRRLQIPNAPDSVLNDAPWLPNATLAVRPTSELTLFGSYTRGFEENGQAPNNAINRGEGVPASRTSQVDAGVRYAFTPGISVVVTAFEIKKPYYNLNDRSVFTHVGELSHKGIEMSFTARIGDGLTIVGGNMFLHARLTGDLVTRGVIGEIPLGRIPRVTRASVEYGPKAWSGFSLDTQIESLARHVGTLDNKAFIPARFSANVGARYRFLAWKVPGQLRFQVQNVTNVFGYDVNGQQLSFDAFEPRRYMVSLTADF
jgi:iron complex outermembrane receptor protein